MGLAVREWRSVATQFGLRKKEVDRMAALLSMKIKKKPTKPKYLVYTGQSPTSMLFALSWHQ
ncbi:hypothetical protein N9Y17_03610 [Gammaproteobacteria bacterium]|nr:hypothetical protein [Gammaproteobacteria bacterium]